MSCILAIDQSTQGTKAILVDGKGRILGRADRPHQQIVNERGWVSHNLDEIYKNVLLVADDVTAKTGIDRAEIVALGISNQRETSAIWAESGTPLNHAVVWQCSRAKGIAQSLKEHADLIQKRTGLKLSPYWPAAKLSWLLKNTPAAASVPERNIRLGTIDTYLVYRLTRGRSYKTDFSNASRTQLLNIRELKWDAEVCRLFDIPVDSLAEICSSDSCFGLTDLEGFLPREIPILSVMGDSHAALFGQGCHEPGMIKTTYGTGSSIMMNIGEEFKASSHGLVTSLAWGIGGKVSYVLEGNINYTGAVISWLKDDVKMILSPGESELAAREANPEDHTILVPAFSGLSAPYWADEAEGLIYGMTRKTGRNELIKAALDSIAYQITAVLDAMRQDSGLELVELRVDGGPTRNTYLMQLQSDLSGLTVAVPRAEELSALGAAYMAGLSCGFCLKEDLFGNDERTRYMPSISGEERGIRLKRWNKAVSLAMC